MKKYEIVCVDDESTILELYESSIEELGCTVQTFTNPEVAIEYILENKNNIISIVSDYKMPEMTGLEFREKIIDKDIYIPFFMVTGFYNKEMALKGMELKISKFIQKPFDQGELLEHIKSDSERHKKLLEEEYEMISSFVDESSPMLDEIEELILELEDSPNDVNCLNTYFRLLHTIKGTASCVGLQSLPEFTHHYEDLVSSLKHGDIKVNNYIIDAMLKGLDVLKRMYDDISKGRAYEFDISQDLKIFALSDAQMNSKVESNEDKSDIVIEKKAEDEKLGIQVSLLDDFMELSGEMTVLRNMILKSVAKIEAKYHGDRDVDVLSDTLDEMHKVSSKLQNQISEMRKVTMASIYRPLKRVVRDSSKKLSKDVELRVVGEDLRIDTSVGKVLSNALVHLVRNGIDHGIETIEKRIEIGKEKEGDLEINTYIEADNIIVKVKDDGNGIDKEKLKSKAIEKELYSKEELDRMSNQRILSLIFDSGFSTASEVTDISGRGVGMDMVRSSIESINGKITIDSHLGKGTTFVMTIPIPRSVLIINSLMVNINENQFAIPLDNVSEVIDVQKSLDMIEELGDGYVLRHHESLLAVVDLRASFNSHVSQELENTSIVILKDESFHYGLVVDSVLDIEEVVVKKLVKKLSKNNVLFEGVTLVGDGEMALILDLEKVAAFANIQVLDQEADLHEVDQNEVSEKVNEFIKIKLNDNSNYCIDLDAINRLEEFDTKEISFCGDLPIYRYRDSFLPIVDLFLENNDFLFKDQEDFKVLVLEKDNKKIGLVVSEISDIISTKEQIDTVFSNGEEISGTVYVDAHTLNVLDHNYIFENYKELRKRSEIKELQNDKLDEAA